MHINHDAAQQGYAEQKENAERAKKILVAFIQRGYIEVVEEGGHPKVYMMRSKTPPLTFFQLSRLMDSKRILWDEK